MGKMNRARLTARTRIGLVAAPLAGCLTAGMVGSLPVAAEPGPSGTAVATVARVQGVAPGGSFAARFASPPASVAPKTRWWWTCGEITPEQIRTQMASIKQAGFKGVEVICFASRNPNDRWGSAAMADRMQVALDAGRDLGLDVDFTVSGSWPLNVPGVLPDDPEAAKEIVQGTAVVQGGTAYAGPVPEPKIAPAAGVTKKELVALQAIRCADDCVADGAPVELQPGTVVDLTDEVENGVVSWTAPAEGTWMLMASWQRGTGQLPVVFTFSNVRPGYVVDHFSRTGTQAGIDFWETDVLTPAMRDALRDAGGDFFEDSLELNSNGAWTPRLLQEFEERRGYDLTPYLPVLIVPGVNKQYSSKSIEDPAEYVFDEETDRRVREDYYQTLTDLYRDHHVEPIQDFAHELGLSYRAQTYGETMDYGQLSTVVDIPETEGLVTDINIPGEARLDDYRLQSASARLGGGLYSTECCAALNQAWGQSWEDLLGRFSASYLGGINQVVLHGVSFAGGNATKSWPGWSPFTSQGGNGFSEAFNDNQATWADVPKITTWMSRMQLLMRHGTARVDLAVFNHSLDRHAHTIDGEPLTDAGYSYEYLNPAHLRLRGARVEDGVLAPDAAGYRGLVVVDQHTMPLDSAQRILRYAEAGLPVVIVGDVPVRTPGRGNDAALASVFSKLEQADNVRSVRSLAEAASALRSLGTEPAAEPAAATELLTARRTSSTGDLYVVHNPTREPISRVYALDGRGAPAVLDPWSGAITPLATYRRSAGATVVRVSLAPGESVVYGLGSFARAPEVHVDQLADARKDVVVRGSDLVLRAEKPGTYRARLSNGNRVKVRIAEVPAAATLNRWDLGVDDWHRGADGTLEVTQKRLTLDGLKPWSQVPELADTSGIGTYTTTFRLPRSWTGGRHATLSLGQVSDTFDITVNGRKVTGVDQVTATADISRYLVPGVNRLQVEVATQLRNALRVTPGYPAQTTTQRQDYGLIGPVVVRPYGQAVIRRGTR